MNCSLEDKLKRNTKRKKIYWNNGIDEIIRYLTPYSMNWIFRLGTIEYWSLKLYVLSMHGLSIHSWLDIIHFVLQILIIIYFYFSLLSRRLSHSPASDALKRELIKYKKKNKPIRVAWTFDLFQKHARTRLFNDWEAKETRYGMWCGNNNVREVRTIERMIQRKW